MESCKELLDFKVIKYPVNKEEDATHLGVLSREFNLLSNRLEQDEEGKEQVVIVGGKKAVSEMMTMLNRYQ